MSGGSNRSRADQLASLLGPDTAAARVDPRSPGARSLSPRPADDGRVAVGGQRDGDALLGGSNRSRADQLVYLAGSRHRRCACRPTQPRCPLSSPGPPTMAVLPSEDSETEAPCWRYSNRSRADQLVTLLGPDTAAARVDPRSPVAPVVAEARPRWPCCRRRTARRRRLVGRLQSLRCRPASAPVATTGASTDIIQMNSDEPER